MSGARRIISGNIAEGSLRGAAMSNALASELCNEQDPARTIKKGIVPSKKKSRGK